MWNSLEERIPNHIGYIYSLLANLFFSLCGLIARKYKHIPSFQLFNARGIVIVLYTIYSMKNKQSICQKNKNTNRLLIIRGLMGCCVGISAFYGYQHAKLGEATSVYSTNAVITGLLGIWILKETLDWVQVVNTILCFVGVLLITKPGFLSESEMTLEESYGLLSMFCSALAISITIILMKMTSKMDPNLSTSYFGILSCVTSPLLELYQGVQVSLSWDEIIALFLIGLFSCIGLNLSSYSLRFGNAGNINLMSYSQIVYSMFFGIVLLGESSNFWSNIGAFLIFFCVGLRFFKNYHDEKIKQREAAKMNSLNNS